MAQGGKLCEIEGKLFQIDGTSKMGGRGRARDGGLTVWVGALGAQDFDGVEERKLPGVGFGEFCDVLPAVFHEFEIPDLMGPGRYHWYGPSRIVAVGDDI
jgi:hypothetical protein